MSKSKSKRHTKPCIFFQDDTCPLSASECDFAHVLASREEFEALKNPQATLRTKPCRFYIGGQCRDGYWCRFKHPANLFATNRSSDSDATLIDELPELESDRGTGTDDDVDVRELETMRKARPEEHPKYRTRPCRNFILGHCVYGDRCSYLHVLPRLKLPLSNRPLPPETTPTSYIPQIPVSSSTSLCDGGTNVDDLDLESPEFATPVRAHFDPLIQTPSASSAFSDEPATPASPATPGNYEYKTSMRSIPSYPLSPASPESYAPSRDHSLKGPLDRTPLSPISPFLMYSPTSPPPLRIVHVPFAVPVYQNLATGLGDRRMSVDLGGQRTQRHGPREASQSRFRSKPCRFFSDAGWCQKGDRCNFFHAPTSPSPSSHRTSSTQRETIALGQESSCVSDGSQGEGSPRPRETEEKKSTNFYKVNWRVVGGGVKVGTGNGFSRRCSEDTSASSQQRPNFSNPFDPTVRLPLTPLSSLEPEIDTKERSRSLNTITSSGTNKSQSSKQKAADRALYLSLDADTFTKANGSLRTSRPIVENPNCAIPLVQSDAEGTHGQEGGLEKALATNMSHERGKHASHLRQHRDVTRAKSSPSSPVAAYHNVPNMIFPAESP